MTQEQLEGGSVTCSDFVASFRWELTRREAPYRIPFGGLTKRRSYGAGGGGGGAGGPGEPWLFASKGPYQAPFVSS